MKEMILQLESIKNAEVIKLSEGEFIHLDNPEVFYLVEEGTLNLYGYEYFNREKGENSIFINTFEEGEAFFNCSKNDSSSPYVVSAYSHGPSTLRKIVIKQLAVLQNDEKAKIQIALVIDNWIYKLRGFFRKPSEQFLLTEVKADGNMHLAQGKSVNIGYLSSESVRVLWVQVEKGSIKLYNDEKLVLNHSSLPFPLLKGVSLIAQEEVDLSFKSTIEILRFEMMGRCLESFHGKLISLLDLEVKRLKNISQLQVIADIHEEKKIMTESCLVLSSVLSQTKKTSFPSSDPLIKACQLIGKSTQVDVGAFQFSDPNKTIDEKILEIADKSGMRYKKVKINSFRFRKDCGAILAFDKDSKTPIVFLPLSRRTYKKVNVVTNEESLLIEDDFSKLSNKGYSFYKELPKHPFGYSLFHFITEGRHRDIITIILMAFFTVLLSLYIPLSVEWIFDKAVYLHKGYFLLQICFGMAMVAVGSSLFSFTKAFAILRLEGKTASKLQSALWSRLLRIDVDFFKKYMAGDLFQRINAIEKIRSVLSLSMLNTFVTSCFAILYFGVMLYRSVALAFIMLVPVFLMMGVYFVAISMSVKRQLGILNLQANIYSFFIQIADAIKKIRVLNAESKAFAKWSEMFAKKKKTEIELMSIQNWVSVLQNALSGLSVFIMYFVMMNFLQDEIGGGASKGGITKIGEFLSFSIAYGALSSAIYSIGSTILSTAIEIIPRWKRANLILKEEREVRNLDTKPFRLCGALELSHVSFEYKERSFFALKNINIKIKEGSFVSFVGPSGSGKSTIIRLLLGFETPLEGNIAYDGRKMSAFDIVSLRKQIGVALQNSAILAGSLRDNIVCDRACSEEEIWEILKICCLDEDIQRFPMKLETIVPAGGGPLTSGQKQRIFIARALVGKPSIIIIDDAINALDNKRQGMIKKNIEKLNMTRIVISQRLSTVASADCIYVFENGEITGQGSYSQLVEKHDLFKKLAKTQKISI